MDLGLNCVCVNAAECCHLTSVLMPLHGARATLVVVVMTCE